MKMATVSGSLDTPLIQKLVESRRICVVLAGGQSRRMGQDKCLLRLKQNGATLLEHTLKVASQLRNCSVILSGEARSEFQTAVPDLPQFQSLGPLGGVASVLKTFELNDKLVLVLPIDMPGLNSDILELLFGALDSNPDRDAVHFAPSVLPFGFRSSAAVTESLLDLENSTSIQHWLSHFDTLKLELRPEWSNALYNLNTPEEFIQFEAGL